MDIKDLEQILELLKQNDITDFELNKEGIQLKLSRAKPEVRMVTASHAQSLEPAFLQLGQLSSTAISSQSGVAASTTIAAVMPAVNENLTKVESPLVGTFYRKASPDSAAFVQEGSRVKKGDTLCIVEAMKLMNEIDAPVAGTVEKILVGDGDVVEFGEVMFLINPGA